MSIKEADKLFEELHDEMFSDTQVSLDLAREYWYKFTDERYRDEIIYSVQDYLEQLNMGEAW